MTSLYHELKSAGIELDSHYSDLYVKDSPQARAIIQRHMDKKARFPSLFISQIDGKPWFDIPFAFMPYWELRAKSAARIPHGKV